MAHWLLKSEPEEWSWDQQVAEGRDGAEWTGIRNFSARNNLRAMKKGEQAFFYHTGEERAIVGIVKVVAEAHPDSTDSAWQAVNVATVKKLPKRLTTICRIAASAIVPEQIGRSACASCSSRAPTAACAGTGIRPCSTVWSAKASVTSRA